MDEEDAQILENDYEEEEFSDLLQKKSDLYQLALDLNNDKNIEKKTIIPKSKQNPFNLCQFVANRTGMGMLKTLNRTYMKTAISKEGKGREQVVEMCKTSIAKTLTYGEGGRGKRKVRNE